MPFTNLLSSSDGTSLPDWQIPDAIDLNDAFFSAPERFIEESQGGPLIENVGRLVKCLQENGVRDTYWKKMPINPKLRL